MVSIIVLVVASRWRPSRVDHRLMRHTDPGFNGNLISDDGGLPIGHLGGVSLTHPLGSSPAPAATSSPGCSTAPASRFIIAFSSTVITLFLGVTVGVIAGYSRAGSTASRSADGPDPGLPADPDPAGALTVFIQRLQSTFRLRQHRRGRLSDPRADSVRLALPRPHRARPGAEPSRTGVRRVGRLPGVGHAADPVPGDPPEPVGAGPRLLDPASPDLHRRRGHVVLPRRRARGADPSWGAMLESSVRYFNVDPVFLFIPGTYCSSSSWRSTCWATPCATPSTRGPGGAKPTVHPRVHFNRVTDRPAAIERVLNTEGERW